MAQPPIGFLGHIPAGQRAPAEARKRRFLLSGSHSTGVPSHEGGAPGRSLAAAMRAVGLAVNRREPPGNTERPLLDLFDHIKTGSPA